MFELYEKFSKEKNLPWHQPNGLKNDFALADKNKKLVYERHRHRYEFNNKFKSDFEKKGFNFVGLSPDGELVEAIELKDHPFFIGTQFHPEYLSRPLFPHPVFLGFVEACRN